MKNNDEVHAINVK